LCFRHAKIFVKKVSNGCHLFKARGSHLQIPISWFGKEVVSVSEKGAYLLHWHYMIFLLPMGLAALFLLLSSLRIGRPGHRGHHGPRITSAGRHSNGGQHRAHGTSGSAHPRGHHGLKVGRHNSGPKPSGNKTLSATPMTLVLSLIGADRAPLPLAIEMYCLSWGIVGFWANRLLLPADSVPSLLSMLPSLTMALVGGIAGARIGSELAFRLMPRDETTAISRHALYGLTGTVVFPATETAGRIHVYDEFGSLHDESCRIANGHTAIAKGRRAIIVDMDNTGRLIVEECAGA
jgi:hypothetical protein